MLIAWLMQLIDLYFPYADNRRYEFKRKLLGFVSELCQEAGSKRLKKLYENKSIKVNQDHYNAIANKGKR